MSIRYIPNLRWKRGEKNALSDLSTAGRANVLPLFLLGSDQFKPKKATKKKAEIPTSDLFAQEVASCWGSSPFYLMRRLFRIHRAILTDLMILAIIAGPAD